MDQMKKGKAPGEDHLTTDILKLVGEDTIDITTQFKKILDVEEIPIQWNEAKVIILFKKGRCERHLKLQTIFVCYHTCTRSPQGFSLQGLKHN